VLLCNLLLYILSNTGNKPIKSNSWWWWDRRPSHDGHAGIMFFYISELHTGNDAF